MVERRARLSTRRMAYRIGGVSHMLVLRALHEEDYYANHDQPVQHLEPGDDAKRMDFCRWIQSHPELLGVILFTDEASFTRDGVNNSRNVHTWSQDNPHETTVTTFHSRFSVNVWCCVIGDSLIGPLVLEKNVRGDTYEVFLRDELPGLLEDIPLMVRGEMYFQHDGAPPHYSRLAREYLHLYFSNRWLGRGGPVAWPPRSPDLTPLDNYIWGHMKTLVYETKVDSRAELRARIFSVAEPIRNHLDRIASAIQSLLIRAEKCLANGG